jgi:hypothetical protein
MVGGSQPAPVVPQHAVGVPSLRVVSGQAAHFPLSNRSFPAGRSRPILRSLPPLYHFGSVEQLVLYDIDGNAAEVADQGETADPLDIPEEVENVEDRETVVITVYEPDPSKWDSGYRKRRKE